MMNRLIFLIFLLPTMALADHFVKPWNPDSNIAPTVEQLRQYATGDAHDRPEYGPKMGPPVPEPGQTLDVWNCGLYPNLEPVILIATEDQKETIIANAWRGHIYALGQKHRAYIVPFGFSKKWAPMGPEYWPKFAVIITLTGRGYYYDFTNVPDGETTAAVMHLMCSVNTITGELD